MNLGDLFSRNALTPSFLSYVAIRPIKSDLSCSIPPYKPDSIDWFTALFANPAATCEWAAIFLAKINASSISFSFEWTFVAICHSLASFAEMGTPDRTISIAFDFPTSLVNLYVPPAPGMTPNLISGKPN